MRALLGICCALAACSAPLEPLPDPDPAPAPSTTGLVLEVKYDRDGVERLSMSGDTVASARHFGPYGVAATKLQTGQTAGFVFEAGDAGGVMVCAEGFQRDGDLEANGCGMYVLRAGEVVTGTLTLIDVR